MFRVLLINPPYDIERYMGKLSSIAFVFPPFGLAYIASLLRESGIDVELFDSQVEERSIRDVVRSSKPDLIGITCVTALVDSTLELGALIREEFPGISIIVGGIHPTLRPDDFVGKPGIDFICKGEGEFVMLEVVKTLEAGGDTTSIPGLITIKAGGVAIEGPKRNLLKNLDEIPPPALDLLPIEKYRISPDMRTGDRVGVIFTSRGCPFDCIFCANRLLSEGHYRAHSIERVCSEIDQLLELHNINQLFVYDDNFAVNKKRAKALCREFIARGYHKRFTWWAEARVDCVDNELLTLMYQAGCRIISYGLESGVQRLLDFIQKNITLEKTREVVQITREVGIDVRASFILGLPTETTEDSLETIRFARSLGLAQVRFAIATPFPGTKLWDIAQQEGGLHYDNWKAFSLMSGYSGGLPVYVPKGRDPKELAKLQRKANMMFYLQPRVIWVYIRRMKDWAAIKEIAVGALKFFRASLFPS